MDLLISRGAAIDPLTSDGYTPLHMAAAQDSEEAILCLLRHGADANLLTKVLYLLLRVLLLFVTP